MTKSNHVALFDPPTAQWTYHRLPEADPAEVGLSIPVAYGCDIAPDDTVWWSQLFGERIGRYDPATEHDEGVAAAVLRAAAALTPIRTASSGCRATARASSAASIRRPSAGRSIRCRPASRPAGFGTSETPYNLNANRHDGQVWINGSNSDTLDPLRAGAPSASPRSRCRRAASFTREIEFDPDNNPWTCTSNEPPGPGEPGRGKFVKVELPPPGRRVRQRPRSSSGEECDDGNTADCDGCSRAPVGCETGCGDGVALRRRGSATTATPTTATAARRRARSRRGSAAATASSTPACGEECEPPGAGGCGPSCTPVPGCGNGVVEARRGVRRRQHRRLRRLHVTVHARRRAAATASAAAPRSATTATRRAATAARRPARSRPASSAATAIVNAACGEECDPPAGGAVRVQLPLPARRRSRSARATSPSAARSTPPRSGPACRSGSPTARSTSSADAPAIDGIANVSVAGPVYFRVPILGGAFGYFCGRITSCTGHVYCRGGTAGRRARRAGQRRPRHAGQPDRHHDRASACRRRTGHGGAHLRSVDDPGDSAGTGLHDADLSARISRSRTRRARSPAAS